MAYSYKGSISFGLVYIPVKLEACVKNNDIGFNMLEKKTLSRVRYKKTCEDCAGRELKNEEIVRGYEYEDGKYVVFDDADFEKLKTAKDKNITIERFVDIAQIDPIYYDKPYYVVPTGGDKAYALLIEAMAGEGKAGIAKTVLGTKETLVAIRSVGGRLLLSTLHFHDEIRQSSVAKTDEKLNDKELDLAKTLLSAMSGDFNAEEYKDEYRERVLAAIEQKVAGKEVTRPRERTGGSIIDIMEALQKSLSSAAVKKTGKAQSAKAAQKSSPPEKSAKAPAKPKLKKAQ